jgi:hypothetical protein
MHSVMTCRLFGMMHRDATDWKCHPQWFIIQQPCEPEAVFVGPRLKTEGSYRITSVHPFVRSGTFSETAPIIFLKIFIK